jgi:hypothetical protein
VAGRIGQLKNPVTSLGIEPMTFWLVASKKYAIFKMFFTMMQLGVLLK